MKDNGHLADFRAEQKRITDSLVEQPSGDWARDTRRGRICADAVIALVMKSENPTILAHMLKPALSPGRWSGIEVGFFQRISEYFLESNDASSRFG